MFVNEGEEETRLRVIRMVVLRQIVTDMKGLDRFRILEKCNLTNKDVSFKAVATSFTTSSSMEGYKTWTCKIYKALCMCKGDAI